MTKVATREAAAATVTADSGVKQNIINMAAAIEADMTVDAKTNTATVGDALYQRLLPEDITPAMVERLQDHNTEFVAAATLALGHKAIPAMKGHKDCERVSLHIPTVHKDSYDLTFDRRREVPNRIPGGAGGMVTKFGSSSVSVTVHGTASKGQLVKVRKSLADLAKAAFDTTK